MEEMILRKLEQIEKNSLLASKNILNVEDVALLTGLSVSTIYKLTHSRQIPFYKPCGKVVFFDKREIEDWLKANRVSTAEEISQQAQSFCMNPRKS